MIRSAKVLIALTMCLACTQLHAQSFDYVSGDRYEGATSTLEYDLLHLTVNLPEIAVGKYEVRIRVITSWMWDTNFDQIPGTYCVITLDDLSDEMYGWDGGDVDITVAMLSDASITNYTAHTDHAGVFWNENDYVYDGRDGHYFAQAEYRYHDTISWGGWSDLASQEIDDKLDIVDCLVNEDPLGGGSGPFIFID